jgi:uncharacterized protein (TIGR02594 family)
MSLEWMDVAEEQIGTDEDKRSGRSNPEIMSWAKDIGGWITSFYKGDDIPWCGLFVGWVMKAAGYPITIKNPLGALEWLKYGTKTTPRYGAIMCFSRSGGGHVGFYVSEDKDYYHILGGNQSDTVNVTKIAKSRFAGAVWPPGDTTQTQKIIKQFDGQVTENEA